MEKTVALSAWCWELNRLRMLKKAAQQGRRRIETGGVPSGAHGATDKEHYVCARRRVGEAAGSPLRMLSRGRTTPGKRRVSARQGWAGEKGDFFSILLVP